jgi:hypothetical protein
MTPARFGELLEAACAETGGTHAPQDVMAAIERGGMQLWIGEDCIGVSEVTAFPRKTVVNVFLAAGDLAEFKRLQPGIEAFGRARGASQFMFMGRATKGVAKRCGWSRASLGCRPGWVLYTKEI